jgi:hypothetical protein
MEKTDLVKFLVGEIEDEQAKFSRFEKAKSRAEREAEQTGKYWRECIEWDGTFPKKSRISDNCKMARRLLLEIQQEETSC